jgi:uncharacterized protein (TIGR02145 family)
MRLNLALVYKIFSMKKSVTILFLFSAFVMNAQESFFRGNNNYQAPIIQLPTISATAVVSGITRYSGVSGGTIIDNGGAPILASGICWSSTSNMPTISDNKTADGSSIGSFVSSITGLTAGVIYNVRAYATNRAGTSYGSVQTFTSTPTAIIPTVGSSYGGGKVAYVYQNGDPGYTPNNIPVLIAANADQVGDLAGATAFWSIGGLSTSAQSVGLIGSAYDALGAGASNTTAIINAYGVGNYAAKFARNYTDGTYSDWYLPSINELAKLYANRVAIGGFAQDRYWSSTETTYPQANFVPAFTWNFNSGVVNTDTKAWNLKFRAVRTTIINPSSAPVLAATSAATSLTPTSAVVGGNVTDQGASQVSARGFVYGTSAGSSTYSVTTGTGAGTFTATLSGLTTGTTYYVRSFATNAQGTSYGSEINFTPDFVITTVTIGSQIWTDRNLEVTKYRNGDPITYASNAAEWSAANAAGQGAYMYLLFANAEGGQAYGKLYNWYAVNDSRGLAPAGYHIPTQAEWTTLRGTQPGNGKTFKTNTTDWGASFSKSNNNLVITPDGSYFNYNGTNTTGFNCLPAGSAFPNGTNGNFGTASFWTATPDATDATKANWTYFHIYFLYDGAVCCGTYEKGNGMSVRLVKD